MAQQFPDRPPQVSRLLSAYDSPRHALLDRGIALRAAPDLAGFRRYIGARQRAEEIAAAEAALSEGIKMGGRRGLRRRPPPTVVDPALRPITWAIALRGDRRDLEDAYSHRDQLAHAYVVNATSDTPAVCGFKPPLAKPPGGGRVARLAPASVVLNEHCRECLVLLYQAALAGDEDSGPWPSADAVEEEAAGQEPVAADASGKTLSPGAEDADERAAAQAPAGTGEARYGERGEYELLGVAETTAYATAYGLEEEWDDGRQAAERDEEDEDLDARASDDGPAATADEDAPTAALAAEDGLDAMADEDAAAEDDLAATADETPPTENLSAERELAPAADGSAAELEPDEADPFIIPIGRDWDDFQEGGEAELARLPLAAEVREDAMSVVGEPADALTTLLELGCEDVLVVAGAGQTALIVGGIGRGADWAGTILDMEHEPVLRRTWGSDEPVHRQGADAQRIIGPFWARSAVLVPLGETACVVFGAARPLEADQGLYFDAARLAAEQFQRPAPEEALADEREVAIAMERILAAPDTSFDAALDHVLTTAASIMGCSLAAGVARMNHQVAMRAVDLDGDSFDPGQLLGSGPLLGGDQRVSVEESRMAGPHLPTVVSRLRLPLAGDSIQALLVLSHTAQRPRGFTTQDHRLAEAIAPAAVAVLERAGFGEGMRELEAHIRSAPSTDPLTGLPNQAAWEAALNNEADRLARHGGSAAVAAFRIDGLRRIDERQGPQARDAALREAAQLLRRISRSTDLAARVAEDEFRVLVRDGGAHGARKLATRVRRAARTAEPQAALPPLTISFANARSKGQLLAASRLVGQRVRSKSRPERPRSEGARAH
ncbi:MAG TPA: GGDEF domain-containing protein [Candidatus Limnocylindria bacterium]|nr:GGDEF domain-containing protein [Candidatus Limnocylindria bacterium]